METLLYALGFIIGALGTAFLLYFLKTRKTLRQQHEIIVEFPLVLHALTKKIVELEKEKDQRSRAIARLRMMQSQLVRSRAILQDLARRNNLEAKAPHGRVA